jgi:hypothetical protein
MAQFLRDEFIKNINIDEDAIEMLNQYFINKATKANESISEIPDKERKKLIPSYIIRFDNKGYRFFEFSEIMKFYNQASDIERIIFTLESMESYSSNRNTGSYIELKLDSKDSSNCYLVASSDDENWVDSVFTGVKELINKFRNKSRFVQNSWTIFFVQIFGVILGFVLSLWAALKISPYLSLENAFVISFLFIFIIFSNLWTFLNRLIIKLLGYSFPILRFKRRGKESLHWLIQTLIGGLIVAFTIFLLNKFFDFIGSVIGGFIKK